MRDIREVVFAKPEKPKTTVPKPVAKLVKQAMRRIDKKGHRYERMVDLEAKPDKKPGEVFVTASGKCYHPSWCNAVNGLWLSGSNALQVVSLRDAESDGYKPCPLCGKMRLCVKSR